tara:strand:+ start:411 stop:557 length:147 start_codon:yes stop_codon:yes gene_type:complete
LKNERDIRCKCGKFWGVAYAKLKWSCGMCRTLVKERNKDDTFNEVREN